jgi:hypothetical protein
MNSEQNPGDSLSADKAAEAIQKVCAALSAEIEDLKKESNIEPKTSAVFQTALSENMGHSKPHSVQRFKHMLYS